MSLLGGVTGLRKLMENEGTKAAAASAYQKLVSHRWLHIVLRQMRMASAVLFVGGLVARKVARLQRVKAARF